MELPYITRMEAGCFMDWILSALSMHIVSEDTVCRKDTYATWVLAKTGYQNQILAGTNIDMSEKKLYRQRMNCSYMKSIRNF